MNIKFKVATLLVMLLAQSTLMAADYLVIVNGKAIKQSLYDYIAKDATLRGQKVDAQVRQSITNKLIDAELIAQEAQRLQLDKQSSYIELEAKNLRELQIKSSGDEDFNTRKELLRYELLTSFYLQDFIKKNPISESEIRIGYDEYKIAYGEKEYSARHILIKTEAEGKEIIEQLSKGGDFSNIAKEKSLDSGSNKKGGDLGWFSLASMVKPFGEAVASLQNGSISNKPVQTQFGWHVIKLINSRPAQPLTYDKVKDGIQKNLQQRNLGKMMAELLAKASIGYDTNINIVPGELEKLPPVTISPTHIDLASAKKQCEVLGFKPKTEKYGKCVLELSK